MDSHAGHPQHPEYPCRRARDAERDQAARRHAAQALDGAAAGPGDCLQDRLAVALERPGQGARWDCAATADRAALEVHVVARAAHLDTTAALDAERAGE